MWTTTVQKNIGNQIAVGCAVGIKEYWLIPIPFLDYKKEGKRLTIVPKIKAMAPSLTDKRFMSNIFEYTIHNAMRAQQKNTTMA